LVVDEFTDWIAGVTETKKEDFTCKYQLILINEVIHSLVNYFFEEFDR